MFDKHVSGSYYFSVVVVILQIYSTLRDRFIQTCSGIYQAVLITKSPQGTSSQDGPCCLEVALCTIQLPARLL